jgi:hypothetical protein
MTKSKGKPFDNTAHIISLQIQFIIMDKGEKLVGELNTSKIISGQKRDKQTDETLEMVEEQGTGATTPTGGG